MLLRGFPGRSVIKNLPASADVSLTPGLGRSLALEKKMATHSSVLAWRIPGMGTLVGCRLWGHTESDTTEAT